MRLCDSMYTATSCVEDAANTRGGGSRSKDFENEQCGETVPPQFSSSQDTAEGRSTVAGMRGKRQVGNEQDVYPVKTGRPQSGRGSEVEAVGPLTAPAPTKGVCRMNEADFLEQTGHLVDPRASVQTSFSRLTEFSEGLWIPRSISVPIQDHRGNRFFGLTHFFYHLHGIFS